MTDKILEFKPATCDGFIQLWIKVPEQQLDRLFNKMNTIDTGNPPDWVTCEFNNGQSGLWAILVVEPINKNCFIEVALTPEGDEVLDGASPQWKQPMESLRLDLIPAVKAALNWELPPYKGMTIGGF